MPKKPLTRPATSAQLAAIKRLSEERGVDPTVDDMMNFRQVEGRISKLRQMHRKKKNA